MKKAQIDCGGVLARHYVKREQEIEPPNPEAKESI